MRGVIVVFEDQRTIIMADDDEEDCFLAKDALDSGGTTAAFITVEDGIELMNFLLEVSRSKSNRLPDLILLDLNMPRKDGREVLLEIKAEPVLQNIPIVILTTSQEEGDISFTMEAGADLFITKPATFDEWVEIMKSLSERWLGGA
jgi:CheY-like chemotaxis protein